jgi:outer membrane lipoprotein-sorting protein
MKIKSWVSIFVLTAILLINGCSSPTPAAILATVHPTEVQSQSSTETTAPTEAPAVTMGVAEMETPAATNGGSNEDAQQAILQAAQKLQQVSFKATTTITSADQTQTNTLEFVPPDRYHLVNSAIEAIIIGNDSYIKLGDQWSVSPIDISTIMQGIMTLPTDLISQVTNWASLGQESLDGTPAQVYSYDMQATIAGVQANSANKIWISTADGLPLKLESQADVNGVTTTTTNVYEYDPNLTIEAPITP